MCCRGSEGGDFKLVPQGGVSGGFHRPVGFVHVEPKCLLCVCDVLLILACCDLKVGEDVFCLVGLRLCLK